MVTVAQAIAWAGGVAATLFSIIVGLLAVIWAQNRKQLEALEARQGACRTHCEAEHDKLHERVNEVEKVSARHDTEIAVLKKDHAMFAGSPAE